MPRKFKMTKQFLDRLVELRVKMSKDGEYGCVRGVMGLLLADKKGVVNDAVFCTPAGCCPGPRTTQVELRKAMFVGLKAGLFPVGAVLLNPDTGGKMHNYFVGGGDSPLSPRYYSVYRFEKLLRSFLMPAHLLVVDNDNVPLLLRATEKFLDQVKNSYYGLISKRGARRHFRDIPAFLIAKDNDEPKLMSTSTEFSGFIREFLAERVPITSVAPQKEVIADETIVIP